MAIRYEAGGHVPKTCITCGRKITPRKKWEKNWKDIKYCSASCKSRKVKPGSLDKKFEETIFELLHDRKQRREAGEQKLSYMITCEEAEEATLETVLAGNEPSDPETASQPLGDSVQEEFTKARPPRSRERCRQAARRLVDRGSIEIVQNGKAVDPSFAKGVMHLRLIS